MFLFYFFNYAIDQSKEPSFRQNLFGLSNINNAINPFAAIFSKLPNQIIRNPNAPSLTNNFESCVDSNNGLAGICVRPMVCAGFGGRLANSCGIGTVCCVSKSILFVFLITIYLTNLKCFRYSRKMWRTNYSEQHVLAVTGNHQLGINLRSDHYSGQQPTRAEEENLPSSVSLNRY